MTRTKYLEDIRKALTEFAQTMLVYAADTTKPIDYHDTFIMMNCFKDDPNRRALQASLSVREDSPYIRVSTKTIGDSLYDLWDSFKEDTDDNSPAWEMSDWASEWPDDEEDEN